MSKADEAMITFEEGFNCSQAILSAFRKYVQNSCGMQPGSLKV